MYIYYIRIEKRCVTRYKCRKVNDGADLSVTHIRVTYVLHIFKGDIAVKTFYRWLTSKENGNRPCGGVSGIIGDLARDAYKDEGFIRHSRGIRILREYLEGAGACTGCLKALDAAYREFKEYRRREGK